MLQKGYPSVTCGDTSPLTRGGKGDQSPFCRLCTHER